MKAYNISTDSTCEEVAEALSASFKLKEEQKNIFIKEGISGDVLYFIDKNCIIDELHFKLGLAKNFEKYLNQNKEKFKPKEINENIPIAKQEEIKSFFEKYIGFKGNLDNIKGENDLKKLSKEDMKKLGLNLGQRIRLNRYINYFNSLKGKEKENKEIKITITENSNDNDARNYLTSELNISEESIGKLGLDNNIAKILFELTEDDIKDCLFGEDQIKQEEYESLIKFIKLRDEMKESNKINKNSSKEEISKFIKNKLNFDIDKQDIKDLNLKIYENLTNDEKEIIQKFID